jgi:hypothetical protein
LCMHQSIFVQGLDDSWIAFTTRAILKYRD